jgi:hypothetical protein
MPAQCGERRAHPEHDSISIQLAWFECHEMTAKKKKTAHREFSGLVDDFEDERFTPCWIEFAAFHR